MPRTAPALIAVACLAGAGAPHAQPSGDAIADMVSSSIPAFNAVDGTGSLQPIGPGDVFDASVDRTDPVSGVQVTAHSMVELAPGSSPFGNVHTLNMGGADLFGGSSDLAVSDLVTGFNNLIVGAPFSVAGLPGQTVTIDTSLQVDGQFSIPDSSSALGGVSFILEVRGPGGQFGLDFVAIDCAISGSSISCGATGGPRFSDAGFNFTETVTNGQRVGIKSGLFTSDFDLQLGGSGRGQFDVVAEMQGFWQLSGAAVQTGENLFNGSGHAVGVTFSTQTAGASVQLVPLPGAALLLSSALAALWPAARRASRAGRAA